MRVIFLAVATAAIAAVVTTPVGALERFAQAPIPVVKPVIERPPVAAALAELLAEAKGEHGVRIKHGLAGARDFYLKRNYAPVWLDDSRLSGQAQRVIARLARADLDGLDAHRYRTPPRDLGATAQESPRQLAQAEFELSLAVLAYAREARGGRVDPSSLGEFVSAQPRYPDPVKVLEELSRADDPAAYLDRFNPQHPAFQALRIKLAELREQDSTTPKVTIPEGPSIKPGMRDPRVPVLRERLGLPPVEGESATRYDDSVSEAVSEFQKLGGLEVDGVVGPQTRAALNGALEAGVEDVLVNMERWRWLPQDMGGRHYVWVNVPEFRLRVMTDGQSAFETRVIVGTRENQTPIFSDEIEYVDVNPYWNVPRSIATKEMLPEVQRDPTFFERRGIEVLYNHEGRTHVINPYTVDWSQITAANLPFRFRQPPGEDNALGRVKFMFPNKHAVYLHDTPTRHLFNRATRAFSHGCVRVENPVAFADALLAFEDDINGSRIKTLITGGRNGSLGLKRHVPVHLTYFTVWVDDAGGLQRRPDIYGHDAALKTALGLGA